MDRSGDSVCTWGAPDNFGASEGRLYDFWRLGVFGFVHAPPPLLAKYLFTCRLLVVYDSDTLARCTSFIEGNLSRGTRLTSFWSMLGLALWPGTVPRYVHSRNRVSIPDHFYVGFVRRSYNQICEAVPHCVLSQRVLVRCHAAECLSQHLIMYSRFPPSHLVGKRSGMNHELKSVNNTLTTVLYS